MSFDLVYFLIHNIVMIKINIHEAKTHLSRYLERLQKGETIVLCKRNIPIAEIRPLTQGTRRKRPLGVGKGKLAVPESFFRPLPEDLLDSFDGKKSRKAR